MKADHEATFCGALFYNEKIMAELTCCFREWPRPVNRKTSIECVKKFLLFEEERLPVPMKIGKFRNFSRQYVAFSSEAAAALGFLFTLCAKTKSKICLIRPYPIEK